MSEQWGGERGHWLDCCRFPEHQPLAHDEGLGLQLRAGGPDGRPAVGGRERGAVRRGQDEDHADGPGGVWAGD